MRDVLNGIRRRASTPRAISCACLVVMAPVCAYRGARAGSTQDVLAGIVGVPLGLIGFAHAMLRQEA